MQVRDPARRRAGPVSHLGARPEQPQRASAPMYADRSITTSTRPRMARLWSGRSVRSSCTTHGDHSLAVASTSPVAPANPGRVRSLAVLVGLAPSEDGAQPGRGGFVDVSVEFEWGEADVPVVDSAYVGTLRRECRGRFACRRIGRARE